MPTLQEVQNIVDQLTPEEQLELGSYATKKWTAAKQSAEELALLNSLPTPITDSDKIFIQEHKNNKHIQRDKIKFTETTIELDGLKFPRTIVKYNDIKNTPWLVLDINVYQKDGHDYFTSDAVKQLSKAWHRILNEDNMQQILDVCWLRYGLLIQMLNYPKAGLHLSNNDSIDYVGTGFGMWVATADDPNHDYTIWANVLGLEDQDLYDNEPACSLVFLQD